MDAASNTPPTPERAVIIYIRGLPGSGKSYLAAALQTALGDSTLVLDPDAIDFTSNEYKTHLVEQTNEGVDPKLHAYRFLRANAYAGIEAGKTMIWNQPFTNLEIFHKMVGRMQDHARAHNIQLAILIVEVVTNQQTAKQRVVVRKNEGGHGPSDATFERFTSDYVTFANVGYPCIQVQGDGDVTAAVTAVQQALNNAS